MAAAILSGFGSAAMDGLFSRVGELVTVVCDYSLGLVVNLVLLPRNAEALTEEMQNLEGIRDHLRRQAELEVRQPQMEVSPRLEGWMNRVQRLASEVTRFLDAFERQSVCVSGLCLGYNATQLLRRVKQLMEEGSALPRSELVSQRGPAAVQEVPFETSSSFMVGARDTLRKLQGLVMDDAVGIIGIYGMGGVGKTTLLKIINNEFLQGSEASGRFEVAIWVTASKDANVATVQKAVADRLGLSLSDPVARQGEILFGKLSKKRFILFLDDVWERLDLMKIGIPRPEKNVKLNCKVLLTTRSERVCNEMGADQIIKVSSLDEKSSRQLFQLQFGAGAALGTDAEVQGLARQVVDRCGGLPISLITVGRAMASARSPQEWQNAIDALDHNALEISGMDQVLASLRFSFDMLRDDTLRSCLLYCALFPEDYDIEKSQIIDYWVCEGFLDPKDGYDDRHIDQTRGRGHARIRDLQDAGLLECGNRDEENTVRLHDTVRDMALWISRNDSKYNFLVLAGRSCALVPQIRRWESAERISLMDNEVIEEPPSWELNCPNLTTLLLRRSELGRRVPQGFFTNMRALQVLDLSWLLLKEFPVEITSLVQLQYLDLSGSDFTSLPKELGNLINLRQLRLERTHDLKSIPVEAISPLSRLQVLNMKSNIGGYAFGRNRPRHPQLAVSDLDNLKRLSELSLKVGSWPSLEMLAASHLLRGCVRILSADLDNVFPLSGVTVSEKIGQLSRLRDLTLHDNQENPVEGELGFSPRHLPDLEELDIWYFEKARIFLLDHRSSPGGLLFHKLRRLTIIHCHGFSDLAWAGQLPCLERVNINGCHGVVELLPDGGGLPHDDPAACFPKLESMDLRFLPELRRISTRPLLFPSLKWLTVSQCPQLKRLPFGTASAKKIQQIKGEEAWWDGLEWDNNADQGSIKSNFHKHFTEWQHGRTYI